MQTCCRKNRKWVDKAKTLRLCHQRFLTKYGRLAGCQAPLIVQATSERAKSNEETDSRKEKQIQYEEGHTRGPSWHRPSRKARGAEGEPSARDSQARCARYLMSPGLTRRTDWDIIVTVLARLYHDPTDPCYESFMTLRPRRNFYGSDIITSALTRLYHATTVLKKYLRSCYKCFMILRPRRHFYGSDIITSALTRLYHETTVLKKYLRPFYKSIMILRPRRHFYGSDIITSALTRLYHETTVLKKYLRSCYKCFMILRPRRHFYGSDIITSALTRLYQSIIF
ncbi:hypothetical protein PRIPAC_94312 [Pristionchus pacificus]|uniref:Uncharacterized protein n=1 Tax=Pristionchus pacificus TaxID=54126 RepID=A0A2A6CI85_PRIPA|nr:hypothetical protein PRIPAC_94312 [Pristionchus pacificus]|eukprot:PDM77788.1 hypothetical protein PRIPAC_34655 [Pristionchus pacificus]